MPSCWNQRYQGANTSPVDEPLDDGHATVPNSDGQVDLDTHPYPITRLRSLLSEDRSGQEFENSLNGLLDRLESTLWR